MSKQRGENNFGISSVARPWRMAGPPSATVATSAETVFPAC